MFLFNDDKSEVKVAVVTCARGTIAASDLRNWTIGPTQLQEYGITDITEWMIAGVDCNYLVNSKPYAMTNYNLADENSLVRAWTNATDGLSVTVRNNSSSETRSFEARVLLVKVA